MKETLKQPGYLQGDLVRFRSKRYGTLIGIITGSCDVNYDSCYVKSPSHPRRFYVSYHDLQKI